MIISLLVFLLIAFYAIKSYAQQSKFEAGVVAGPNYSILYGNWLVNKSADPKIGLTSGLAFQYNLKKRFTLNANIYFERKGCQNIRESEFLYKDSFLTNFKSSSYYHADYISIPILARLTFGKKVKFFINAGPYFSYLLAWNESHHFNAPEIREPEYNASYYYNYTENFRRYDFGISSGAGLSFPIQDDYTLTLEARNNLGLANISVRPVVDNKSIKNFSGLLLFGLNYKIPTDQ
ncbi:MAG: porin family protein [Bacteroidia bacterium]